MYINLELVWKEAFQVQSVFMHSVLCYHGLPTSVLSVLPVCVVLYCCTKLMPLSKQMTRYFVFTFRKKTTTYYNHSFCCCFVFNKYYYSLAEPSMLSQTTASIGITISTITFFLLPRCNLQYCSRNYCRCTFKFNYDSTTIITCLLFSIAGWHGQFTYKIGENWFTHKLVTVWQ